MDVRAAAPLLVVSDLGASVDFYARLGFAVVTRWDTYAMLRADADADTGTGTGAALHLALPGEPPPDRPSVALAAADPGSATVSALLVLTVDDCARAADELAAAGVELLSPPATPVWGGEIRAFLRDPDGHLIELNQPTA